MVIINNINNINNINKKKILNDSGRILTYIYVRYNI